MYIKTIKYKKIKIICAIEKYPFPGSKHRKINSLNKNDKYI